MRQKAPSAKRCIKTGPAWVRLPGWWGQKAPSAKRCIKTVGNESSQRLLPIPARKHRAPKGALRHGAVTVRAAVRLARKHRAPKGALRPDVGCFLTGLVKGARKHRAPKGALRQSRCGTRFRRRRGRQKAPSAKRCIKTKTPAIPTVQAVTVSESTERQTVH